MKRREFVGAAALFGVAGTGHAKSILKATPPEIEGPFYPVVAQADQDFDLTLIRGHDEKAKGEAVFISGQVVDNSGNPISDATVDIWQANVHGRYRHPHDSNPAPLDEHFQGWAIVRSGAQGRFRFKTIIPGAYPASRNWQRPPHIHFKVSKRGYVELVTQMYFPGEKLNDDDRLLQRHSSEEQALMIAAETKPGPDGERQFVYRIVLTAA